jgi:phosphate uptake regulator
VSEPENHTLHLLREIRTAISASDNKLEGKIEALDKKFDRIHADLRDRIENLAQIIAGESVIGRYAAAGVALERRISALEEHR